MADWFEDESFWRDFYPFLFPRARFEQADEEIGKILDLTGVASGTVLDLCCGPGRHSVALARRGFHVTSVDRSPFLLDKARKLGREAGVEVEWVEEDMRRFERPGSFGLVLNLFTSFGYFDDKDDDVRVLENLHASLEPGGVCVIDVLGKEILAARSPEWIVDELDDGALLLQKPTITQGWSRVESEWKLVRGEEVRSFSFDHTIYSGQELHDRFLQAGFAAVEFYGTFDGAEYGVKAERLVVVGRTAA